MNAKELIEGIESFASYVSSRLDRSDVRAARLYHALNACMDAPPKVVFNVIKQHGYAEDTVRYYWRQYNIRAKELLGS